jgi:uracil-DNA glycosylase
MPRSTDKTSIPLAKPVGRIPAGSLRELKKQAKSCQMCPLWRQATQTVFGTGRATARVMLIGEQPGAQEDEQGQPFVGPAGKLLDRALSEAGLERSKLYVTNTVKHFKFEQRGKARLHARANAAEQAACRPWLAAELDRIQPRRVIALGLMAAQTLFGNNFRMGRDRGQWRAMNERMDGLATWHPSSILRLRGEDERRQAFAELVADLKLAAGAVED